MYSLILFLYEQVGEGNGNPLQYSCLENPMDRGAWWAAVMGLRRVGHDWETSLSLFTFMHWRRKWQPTPVFLPGEPQGWRSLVGCCLWGRTELDTTEATQQQQQQHEQVVLKLSHKRMLMGCSPAQGHIDPALDTTLNFEKEIHVNMCECCNVVLCPFLRRVMPRGDTSVMLH